MKNTRIHLPRYNYEEYIKTLPNNNLFDIKNPSNDHYNIKYLKYIMDTNVQHI